MICLPIKQKNKMNKISIGPLLLFFSYAIANPSISTPQNDLLSETSRDANFIISYSFLVKNEIPYGEKYNVSKPIIKKPLKQIKSCEIDIRASQEITDDEGYLVESLLKFYKNEVIECLQSADVHIRSDELSKNGAIKSKTLMQIPPTLVNAYIDNGFLIMQFEGER